MTVTRFARIGAACGMTALAGWSSALLAANAPRETSYATHGGIVVVPESSQIQPGQQGEFAHTNIRIFYKGGIRAPSSTPPVGFETPGSLACVYGLVAPTTGCNPQTATTLPTGGSKLVIVVDAYDDPTAANDLGVYSAQFGLPAVTSDNFAVVYASGTQPAQDSTGGWELEEALDIEMAHAMAPNAKVILMEAASNSTKDLLAAEAAATKLAEAAGGGEVSNSWSGGEFAKEADYDSKFNGKNVVYLASTGDSPGTGFPSVLENVIGAGGTSILRNSSHNFVSQGSWASGGGGSSAYVAVPPYQAKVKAVEKVVGKMRGVPDFSFDANPGTGVVMYDSTPYHGSVPDWLVIGGTSVASPALAGILNAAGSFAASTQAELTVAYKGIKNTADWTDIVAGKCGNNGGASAVKGWDFCTGIGVPNGYGGK